MKPKILLIILMALMLNNSINAQQGVSINSSGANPDSSAMLDIVSTTKGLLIPRMTTAERNAVISPAKGLMIYNLDCDNFNYNSGTPAVPNWLFANPVITLPSAPAAAVHIPSQTQIVWNWNTVSEATGYKWGTTDIYSSSTDNGNDTTYTQTGLTCGTNYTLYVWAYNVCGNSVSPVVLTQATSACPWSCGSPVTDSRDAQSYGTVMIGSQCWITKNMNYDQDYTGNDWCYNNDANQCTTYGRLYDWAAAMQGAASSSSNPSGVQGVCPSGWHLPSDAEFCVLENYLVPGTDPGCSTIGWRGGAGSVGGKIKETGTTHWFSPNTGATNSSGFTGLPAGCYSCFGYGVGNFGDLQRGLMLWIATEYNSTQAYRRQPYYDQAGIYRGNDALKTVGFSVRCIKD